MVVPRGTSSSLSLGLFSVTCVARSSEVASTGEEALVLASLADIRRGTPECPRWGEEGEEGEEGGGRGGRGEMSDMHEPRAPTIYRIVMK